jgi:hypothetical protein
MYIDPLGLAHVDVENWFNEKYTYISGRYDNTFGAYEWDASTNTASITIVAHGHLYFSIFDERKNSDVSLVDGRLHVDERLLWQYFGLAIDPSLIHTPFKDSMIQGSIIGTFIWGGPKIPALASRGINAISRWLGLGSPTVDYLIKNAEKLKRTNTVLNNISTRPYINSTHMVQQIMRTTDPMKDPGTANGLKWVVRGTFNGSNGVYELVINPDTMTILHFVFKSS